MFLLSLHSGAYSSALYSDQVYIRVYCKHIAGYKARQAISYDDYILVINIRS